MLLGFNKFLLGTCIFGLLIRRSICQSNITMSSALYTPGTHSIAYITFPDETVAKKVSHDAVTKKLAACANIIPGITSIYEWEGTINSDPEVLVMMKTRTSKVDELSRFIRENHPYSVAEVITVPIENGNPPYLDWITKSIPEK